MLNKLNRALLLLIPSGIKNIIYSKYLKKKYNFASVDHTTGYQIAKNNRFGKNCRLGGPGYISGSEIGDYTYIETNCRISATKIGKFCSIAPYTIIGLAEHPVKNFVSTHPIFYRNIPTYGYDFTPQDNHVEITQTTIGNDVWIGAGVTVKSGLDIGHGAVIGAGAVVTKDIPPYAIYAGVPAHLIRYRFDRETISFLLKVKWWDKDIEWLRNNVSLLQNVSLLKGEHKNKLK